MPVPAVRAFHAGHFGGDTNPVSQLITLDGLTDFDDLGTDFVPLHQRSAGQPVPFHHVASADAAGDDLHQHLARPRLGSGNLLQPDILVIVPDRG